MINNYAEMRSELAAAADDEYREFAMRGIPSERPFIGVRIPLIRAIVAEIPEEKIPEFLAVEPVAIEEVLARGMMICRLPYEGMMREFDTQVGYIGDWCTCDTFCSGLGKVMKNHRDDLLKRKIDGLLESDLEFTVRVGLVLLKCYFVDCDYLAMIFDRVERLRVREEYYTRMAIAWLVAECSIKFPEVTLGYLKVSRLPKWTYNKTISKICDSYRVEEGMKEMLRGMRR